MAINKVNYGNETLIDISNDEVTADDVLSGVSFHSADGVQRSGTLITHDVVDNLTSTSTDDALSANQGRVLKGLVDSKADASDIPSLDGYATEEWVGEQGYLTEEAEPLAKKIYEDGFASKNLLQVTATTQTKNGITFTVNSDKSITVSGTATANTFFSVGNVSVPIGSTIRFCGCPQGGSNSSYYVYIVDGTAYPSEIGSGRNYTTVNSASITFGIAIFNGTTVSNLVFKPMITTDLSVTYSDYKYVPSNVVLQSEVDDTKYKAGDRFSMSNPLYISGMFQSSTQIRVTIPLCKEVIASNVATTISNLQYFINGNYKEVTSNLSVQTYKVEGVGIMLYITKSDGFDNYVALSPVMMRILATVSFS